MPVRPARQAFRIGLLAVASFLSGSGCLTPTPPPVEQAASIRPKHLRDVRVLLEGNGQRVQVWAESPYQVVSSPGAIDSGRSLPRSEVRSSERGTVVIGARDTGLPVVDLIPQVQGSLYWAPEKNGAWSASRRVAGKLRFAALPGRRISVTNYVNMEDYLVGVLVGELYADFDQQAFNAAAVVARTYALVEMGKKAQGPYDVTATESSQVYLGLPDGPAAERARKAVDATRGVVCTWNSPTGKRIFPTYYSSACGGVTQAAGNFKPESAITPLQGNVKCDYCRIAKGEAYRWKPVRVNKSTVLSSLLRRDPDFASFSGISRIETADQTADGRLIRLRIVGPRGESKTILAEEFRLALGSRKMRSTACRIVDEGRDLLFTDGRGFGHGMGLCQWGMQGQALAGRSASEILKYYYPGVELVRAY